MCIYINIRHHRMDASCELFAIFHHRFPIYVTNIIFAIFAKIKKFRYFYCDLLIKRSIEILIYWKFDQVPLISTSFR